jgi:hypothetical protein
MGKSGFNSLVLQLEGLEFLVNLLLRPILLTIDLRQHCLSVLGVSVVVLELSVSRVV